MSESDAPCDGGSSARDKAVAIGANAVAQILCVAMDREKAGETNRNDQLKYLSFQAHVTEQWSPTILETGVTAART